MNKLVVIGILGIKRAYLNIPLEEAVQRYKQSDSYFKGQELNVKEFEFEDEFEVYEAWGI